MAKTISITVDKVGRFKTDTKGYVGTECKNASKAYLDLAGNAPVEEEIKPEMYQQAATEQQNQIGGAGW